MSYDYNTIIKRVLKRIYICVLISAIVCGAIVLFFSNANTGGAYTVQVFIDQDFAEKHPVAGVTYLDSVETKTKTLMNNSLVSLKSETYLKKVTSDCGVSIKSGSLENYIDIKKASDNIITIKVQFADLKTSKSIGDKIVETASIQLNSTIMNNIDESTGNFKEGVLDSEKIAVYLINSFDSSEKSQKTSIKAIVIYFMLSFVVSTGVLFVVEMIMNKVGSANYLRKCFNVATDEVDCFYDGVIKMMAERQADQRVMVVATADISNESLVELGQAIHKDNIIYYVGKACDELKDNNIVCYNPEYVLTHTTEFKEKLNKEKKYVIVVIDNCFKNTALDTILSVSDKSVLFVKKEEDSLKSLKTLVTRVNDKQLILSNLCIYKK